MLYVVTDLHKRNQGTTWHVGQVNPIRTMQDVWDNADPPIGEEVIHHVMEVQADSDELDYILDSFANIPLQNSGRVQRWFGDHAKFIAANL